MLKRFWSWWVQFDLSLANLLAGVSLIFGLGMVLPCNQYSSYPVYATCRNWLHPIHTPLWIWGIAYLASGLLYVLGEHHQRINLCYIGCTIGVFVWLFVAVSIWRQLPFVGAPYINVLLAYAHLEGVKRLSRPQASQ